MVSFVSYHLISYLPSLSLAFFFTYTSQGWDFKHWLKYSVISLPSYWEYLFFLKFNYHSYTPSTSFHRYRSWFCNPLRVDISDIIDRGLNKSLWLYYVLKLASFMSWHCLILQWKSIYQLFHEDRLIVGFSFLLISDNRSITQPLFLSI